MNEPSEFMARWYSEVTADRCRWRMRFIFTDATALVITVLIPLLLVVRVFLQ